MDDPDSITSRRPWLLVVLSVLVACQGLALLAVGCFYVLEAGGLAGSGEPEGGTALVVAMAAVALIVAAGLLAAARGLYLRQRWARAPALVVQLLVVLVVAAPDGVLTASHWFVGLPLLIWALAVGCLLFVPGLLSE